MKTCPRCGAVAFDDAALCFGCLYQYERDINASNVLEPSYESVLSHDRSLFEDDGRRSAEPEAIRRKVPLHPACSPAYSLENQDPPEFCIHLIPRHNSWGGWKWDCSVEIAEKVQHEVVGRHAVQVH